MADELFWKLKLWALLHDVPDKCFDIAGHETVAATYQTTAGLDADFREFRKDDFKERVKAADHFASAADRFCFPAGECSTEWDGQLGSTFIHPLSSEALTGISAEIRKHAGNISGILQAAIGGIDENDFQKKHFLYWRRWMENAVGTDDSDANAIPFLPADSRIPDHSIWNHAAITSAVAGAMPDGDKPALLLFQMGNVQSFIAQARTTRDLWSGSYLISWLIAHAMKAVTDKLGPDAIIFPSLKGNGIFDALHREEMYQAKYKGKYHGKDVDDTLWERMKEDKGTDLSAWLCTPTLPNRFLALVPSSQANDLANSASEAVGSELKYIGEVIWKWIKEKGGKEDWKDRWNVQIKAFPQTAYAIQPWLERDDCLKVLENLPNKDAYNAIKEVLAFAEQESVCNQFSEGDRKRYYDENGKLKDPGVLWSAHYALLDAKLAARRNTRNFDAWDSCTDKSAVKDSLSGIEECIGDEEFWNALCQKYDKIFTTPTHRYGAMNLIKRLWCRSDVTNYLFEKLEINENQFQQAIRFESVKDVADENKNNNPYVAILAFDGDEMGKWVSGVKLPGLLTQVSDKAKEYLNDIHGANDVPRLLSPSYHLQFSEALANFATKEAEKIVKSHDGQLIYAGGDDVLAMLPATEAIECARELRDTFRKSYSGDKKYILPGNRMDVSVGLAIGHSKAPLQMLVREAQAAEKRAKSVYGRAAFAVSLYKRSGEIIHWGAKWDSNAIDLMRKITTLTEEGKLSKRFPYALAALLKPYQLKGENSEMVPIIKEEVRHVIMQQGSELNPVDKKELEDEINKYLNSEQIQERQEDFINLFMTETFINRNGEGEDNA